MQGLILQVETVTNEALDSAILFKHDRMFMGSTDLPLTLRGDQLRLKQIMINLVKNALKFTRTGSVRIVSAYDKDQSLLKVHVVDTGIGIKAEEMDKLFNMFGKLLRTAEMNHEGIGMGLLISKNLVELNGGTIDVYSDGPGEGSVFTFTF